MVIKTGAQEVDLDLIVRDAKGRIVKNLQADQIQIFEDGTKQEIKSFHFVSGRESTKGGGDSNAGRTTGMESSVLGAPNLVCLVFHGLDPYTKKNAMDAAKEFLNTQLQPNTWIAAFSLDSNLVPLHEFTTNRAELIKATTGALTGTTMDFARVADAVLNASPNIATINSIVQGNPAQGGSVSASMDITGGELNTKAINGADVSTGTGANRQRGDLAGQRRQFGNIAGKQNLDQLKLLIGQLATLPGHKTVLLLSTGLSNDADPDHFDAILKKANQGGITFYSLDVNGLTQNSNALAVNTQLGHAVSLSASQAGSTASAAANMEKMRQDDYLVDAVRNTNTQATMRALAEGTGGFLIGSTNDLRKPFQHMAEDLETHYEAVYRPTDDKMDGRLRTIEVKTTHPDWTIESRTGYYAMPAMGGSAGLTSSEMLGLAALNVKTTPHAFTFGAAALQFRPTTAGAQAAIAFELPAANLKAVPTEGNKLYRIHVSVLTLIKNADGEVVDKFSQDAPFEVPAESLATAQKSMLNFTHAVDLPPGHYTVEIAATDQENNGASVNRFAFENPERKGVALSSIALVQRMDTVKGQPDGSDPFQVALNQTQSRRVVPETRNAALNSTAHPYVYFVVYPDKANGEKPKIQVEILVNKQVIAKQDANLPAPDVTGAIPMVVGAAAKPGDCELRITALQGPETSTQTLAYTVNP